MDSTPISGFAPSMTGTPCPAPLTKFALSGWLLLPAILAVLAVVSVFTVDLPMAGAVRRWGVPDGIGKFLEAAEHFGTFYGNVLIFLAIAALDPTHRRSIVRLAGAAWTGGLADNLVKLLFARTRPKYFDFADSAAGHGFLGWAFQLKSNSRIQSFPSGHTATAVALAFAMTFVYPRGRWVFMLMAVLVALQRIATESHFVSDCLIGAAVGWLAGLLWTAGGPLTHKLDAFEAARS
jgi:membrane-associated phospholipid phosphatase